METHGEQVIAALGRIEDVKQEGEKEVWQGERRKVIERKCKTV